MSPAFDANAYNSTKRYESALLRFRQHLIGAIAVSCSRQSVKQVTTHEI
jgi:hypothetical protein